eukprot:CAMPEP_0203747196 /NCGR_PEP_ID=MMETSP0098-20131031/2422_1 /ASSEMBLY_ACC=CAM_ASM_000208 /TAXON_ID=96639 /ORGANISM=" , Strain NY0313808BC1" /LENGTH=430 /DNA_ID=CAMNT_0050635557 /DNA_START=658 /DNA_END=1946 /DNA_ORIENTATION=+
MVHKIQNWGRESVGLPRCKPEDVGMDGKALERLDSWMEHLVNDVHNLPMATTLVARKGKVVYYKGCGEATSGEAVQPDSIFRIYSMTKPITSIAILMLLEEGKLLLEHPAHLYLGPSWKKENMQVLESFGGTPRPCRRTITIKHLLTHTAGLAYGFLGNETINPVDGLYQELSRTCFKLNENLGEMVERLAKLPLCHEPGEKFNYSLATDVLGRIVEVVSGKALDVFLEERVFVPLGMKDTHFFLHNEKESRLVDIKSELQPSGKKVDLTHVQKKHKEFTEYRRLLSGGGGLVSTMHDYARFTQCCLNGGELYGVRILSRKTFEFATINHLVAKKDMLELSMKSSAGLCPPGVGFGLGFACIQDTNRSGLMPSEGTFYWSGMASTLFFCDPKEELFAIFYTQVVDVDEMRLPLRTLLYNIVYGAIQDGRV